MGKHDDVIIVCWKITTIDQKLGSTMNHTDSFEADGFMQSWYNPTSRFFHVKSHENY